MKISCAAAFLLTVPLFGLDSSAPFRASVALAQEGATDIPVTEAHRNFAKRIYAKIDAALLKRDFATYEALEASDYFIVGKDGKTTPRAQADKNRRELFALLSKITAYETVVYNIEADKEGVHITTTLQFRGVMPDKNKVDMPFVLMSTTRDSWRPVAGKTEAFELASTLEISTNLTINGVGVPLT